MFHGSFKCSAREATDISNVDVVITCDDDPEIPASLRVPRTSSVGGVWGLRGPPDARYGSSHACHAHCSTDGLKASAHTLD